MITEIDVVAAAAPDGASLLPTVARVEEHLAVTVEGATGDTAYGEVENRVASAARGIDLLSPVATPAVPPVDQSALLVNEVAGALDWPGGHNASRPRVP